MKVIVSGHRYELANFENKEAEGQFLQFIHKQPKEGGEAVEMETVQDGTSNEEVIEAVIDRLKYLNGKFPCKENACAITKLEEALMWLEKRTSDRMKRNVEGKNLS